MASPQDPMLFRSKRTTDTDQWIRFRRGGNPRGEAGVIFSEFDNDHFFVNNVEDALAFSRSTENSATPDFANSNELMRLAANGNLGVGTAAPGSKFHVEDNFTSNTSFVATIQNTANGGYANGLKIQAGENSQSQNNRLISFARPDGSEIGAVRQITSNSVDYNTTSDDPSEDQYCSRPPKG
jgi:hypothetical protein